MGRICLKCGYERRGEDSAPDYECPKCRAVYWKVEAAKARQDSADAAEQAARSQAATEKAQTDVMRWEKWRRRAEKRANREVQKALREQEKAAQTTEERLETGASQAAVPPGATRPTSYVKAVLLGLVILLGAAMLLGRCVEEKDGSQVRAADDIRNLYLLGEGAKLVAHANSYDVAVWDRALNVYTGSILPGEARAIADGLCEFARLKLQFERPWEVRVFLVVGERPAAVCKISGWRGASSH